MTNPLHNAAPSTRDWPVGETRMIGKSPDCIPVTRTPRDYVYDLCDAYNEHRCSAGNEWFVHNGQLHLGTPLRVSLELSKRIEREKEAERTRWKQNYYANQRRDEAA